MQISYLTSLGRYSNTCYSLGIKNVLILNLLYYIILHFFVFSHFLFWIYTSSCMFRKTFFSKINIFLFLVSFLYILSFILSIQNHPFTQNCRDLFKGMFLFITCQFITKYLALCSLIMRLILHQDCINLSLIFVSLWLNNLWLLSQMWYSKVKGIIHSVSVLT